MTVGKIVGYIRVSSVDQNESRQLEGYICDKVFIDKVSGKDKNRPQLEEMIKYVREGDTVVCHSMDRLARNLDDLRALVNDLTSREVKVEFVKEALTFKREESKLAMENLMLSVVGAVAEFERSLIRERQKEGIALAKKRGAFKGRKSKLTEKQIEILNRRIQSGESKMQVASDLNLSRATLYNYLAAGKAKQGENNAAVS